MPFSADEELGTSLASLKTKIQLLKQKIEEELGHNSIAIDVEEIEKSYLKEYLVRALLIGDGDVRSKNYGFIYDFENRKVKNFVNYDYEFGFNKLAELTFNSKKNIKFIFNNYPEISQWFYPTAKNDR